MGAAASCPVSPKTLRLLLPTDYHKEVPRHSVTPFKFAVDSFHILSADDE